MVGKEIKEGIKEGNVWRPSSEEEVLVLAFLRPFLSMPNFFPKLESFSWEWKKKEM